MPRLRFRSVLCSKSLRASFFFLSFKTQIPFKPTSRLLATHTWYSLFVAMGTETKEDYPVDTFSIFCFVLFLFQEMLVSICKVGVMWAWVGVLSRRELLSRFPVEKSCYLYSFTRVCHWILSFCHCFLPLEGSQCVVTNCIVLCWLHLWSF